MGEIKDGVCAIHHLEHSLMRNPRFRQITSSIRQRIFSSQIRDNFSRRGIIHPYPIFKITSCMEELLQLSIDGSLHPPIEDLFILNAG